MKFQYSNLRSGDATTVLNTCVSLPLQNPEVLFDPFKFVFHTFFSRLKPDLSFLWSK